MQTVWMAHEMVVKLEAQLRDRELERKERLGLLTRGRRPSWRAKPLAATVELKRPTAVEPDTEIRRAA